MTRFLEFIVKILLSPITQILLYIVSAAASVAWGAFGWLVMAIPTTGFIWWMAALAFTWSVVSFVFILSKLVYYGFAQYKVFQQLRQDRAVAARNTTQREANITAGVEAFSKLKPDLNFIKSL